jgi:ATP-dependent Clp protease adaptor protein ClpS
VYASLSPPEVINIEDLDEVTDLNRGWNVIVWDDPVNTMQFVVLVFRSLFGFSHEKATVLMLQVHHEGKSIVATEPQSLAEKYCAALHEFGLLATIEEL